MFVSRRQPADDVEREEDVDRSGTLRPELPPRPVTLPDVGVISGRIVAVKPVAAASSFRIRPEGLPAFGANGHMRVITVGARAIRPCLWIDWWSCSRFDIDRRGRRSPINRRVIRRIIKPRIIGRVPERKSPIDAESRLIPAAAIEADAAVRGGLGTECREYDE